jgi:prepilin-type N-terminal cleavage/methylation domain-containing protein
MAVKRKKTGFTMVEILTVVGIIAILVAVLIPALTMVRRIAKETQQKAQLIAIDLALMAFKGDQGYYPPSDWPLPPNSRYPCGAQKLAEALLGWDLLGFHPNSEWNADGEDDFGTEIYHRNLDPTNDPDDRKNLDERRGPYLELATANAFRLGVSAPSRRDGLFDNPAPLEKDTFVICDVFGIKKITLANGEIVKAGAPILYYRANTSKKNIDDGEWRERIYNAEDNFGLIGLGRIKDGRTHAYALYVEKFYTDITDPKVAAMKWPYRPDSYILISAGADGLYGTSDDICNF